MAKTRQAYVEVPEGLSRRQVKEALGSGAAVTGDLKSGRVVGRVRHVKITKRGATYRDTPLVYVQNNGERGGQARMRRALLKSPFWSFIEKARNRVDSLFMARSKTRPQKRG